MLQTLSTIRILFFLLCLIASYTLGQIHPELSAQGPILLLLFGAGIAIITILIELSIKNFSIRGLSSLILGLIIGLLCSFLFSIAPIFQFQSPQITLATKLIIFLTVTYLSTTILLRNKDDLNLLIPFIRFTPNNNSPLILLDTSALIDGRITTICQSRFVSATLIVPKFIIDELHKIADSNDVQRQIKGRRGIEVLNKLKNMNYIDLRVKDFDIENTSQIDSKLIYIAQSLKTKLLTTDYNLAKLAEFHSIEWLNINALSKALNPEVSIGQYIDVDIVKPGREPHQGVGYLSDGSMIVVNEAIKNLGQSVVAEIINILPSAGGKMIFARLHTQPTEN